MALDRRITIHIEAIGRRATQQDVDDGLMIDGVLVFPGDYIDGPTASYPVWAEQRAAGSSDTATSGGTVITSVRNYSVRWFHALAVSVIAFVSIEDEDGLIWDADDVSLSDARRRVITISALRQT